MKQILDVTTIAIERRDDDFVWENTEGGFPLERVFQLLTCRRFSSGLYKD